MNGLVRRPHDGRPVNISNNPNLLKNHGKECINLFLEVCRMSPSPISRSAVCRLIIELAFATRQPAS